MELVDWVDHEDCCPDRPGTVTKRVLHRRHPNAPAFTAKDLDETDLNGPEFVGTPERAAARAPRAPRARAGTGAAGT